MSDVVERHTKYLLRAGERRDSDVMHILPAADDYEPGTVIECVGCAKMFTVTEQEKVAGPYWLTEEATEAEPGVPS